MTKDFFNESLNIEKSDVVLFRAKSGALVWAYVDVPPRDGSIMHVITQRNGNCVSISRHEVKGLIKNDVSSSVDVYADITED
jgi:hypothetical protein